MRIPRHDESLEQVAEVAFLTVFSSDLSANGRTPVMSFQGRDRESTYAMTDAYTFFFRVGQRCHTEIERARSLLNNLLRCMGTDRQQEDAAEALRLGGSAIDRMQDRVTKVLGELSTIAEKRKPAPRDPARATLYSDEEFMRSMCEGLAAGEDGGEYDDGSWSNVRSVIERLRVWSRMQCVLYAEVLADNTPCRPDGSLTEEECIGIRYSFWLLNQRADNENGNAPLLSFDHAVEATILENRRRREEERRQETARANLKGGKRGRDDDRIERLPSELKFCFYSDVLRRTYPSIYGVESQQVRDSRSSVVRAEFAVSREHLEISASKPIYGTIVDVSSRDLVFSEPTEEGGVVRASRRVSCRFADHYAPALAIQRKERRMQPEQQDPLSYMRSDGPRGLDARLRRFVDAARILACPGYLCTEDTLGRTRPSPDRMHLLRQILGVCDPSLLAAIAYDGGARTAILNTVADVQVRDLVAQLVRLAPWSRQLYEPGAGPTDVPNEWFCPARHESSGVGEAKTVSFKGLLRRLSEHATEHTRDLRQRILENQSRLETVGCEETEAAIAAIRSALEEDREEYANHFRPCELLKALAARDVDLAHFRAGIHCDAELVPAKVRLHCFYQIHIRESFPNLDGRYVDCLRRAFPLRAIGQVLRSRGRSRPHRDVFVGSDGLGAGMIETVHGTLDRREWGVVAEHELVHTEETATHGDLHTVIDLVSTSPLAMWGEECQREYVNWMQRFASAEVENYAFAFPSMLGDFLEGLFHHVYTRDDMCERSCALRDYAMRGVFGSMKADTLTRKSLAESYDPTMEDSVNAKQLLMHVFTSGYRQGFTQRASLMFSMVVLTSGDPTIGSGTGRRQPVHGNILGGAGTGKSMIEDMLLDMFPPGYVVRKGPKTAAAHRTLSRKQSLHCGANLMDEGNVDDRVGGRRGDNRETGNSVAEAKKERLSSGEVRSTMAYIVRQADGQSNIATVETITNCRNVEITARNDTLSQIIGPLADRALNWQLKPVRTDINPDELAADEPVRRSAEWEYQERVRDLGRTLCAQTLVLLNAFGALSGFAECVPAMDVSSISFVRPAVARVLERNGQPRFPPRMTGKVVEMMKVSAALGAAVNTFWRPWGLFSTEVVRAMGGPNAEFGVRDLVRDPRCLVLGGMYCDFQDALAAYVQLLNQDRIDEVNAVRSAFVRLVRSARYSYWEMFTDGFAGSGETCDLNRVRIAAEGGSGNGGERRALWALANRLKKGVAGDQLDRSLEGYTAEQIVDILQFITEDERYAFQHHRDDLDLLLPGKVADEPLEFTVRSLRDYRALLATLDADPAGPLPNELHRGDAYRLSRSRLEAAQREWGRLGHGVGDDSRGRLYFPGPLHGDSVPCSETVDVRTIDLSQLAAHGRITVSTWWLREGMLRESAGRVTDVGLQRQIVEEVASSAVSAGFYATPGIGMSNIRSSAPQIQDVFYVAQSDRVQSVRNSNYVSARNSDMYGEAVGVRPESMVDAWKSLEPRVPESLQSGMRHWSAMMRQIPTVCVTEHFVLMCDKRGIIVLAPYLIATARALRVAWARGATEVAPQDVAPEDAVHLPATGPVPPVPERRPHKDERIDLVRRVLPAMFDAPPELTPLGFRHLARDYLCAADHDGRTGRDLYRGEVWEKRFRCAKRYLAGRLGELMRCPGEGLLGLRAANRADPVRAKERVVQLVRSFNAASPTRAPLTAKDIESLGVVGGRLGRGEFTEAQHRTRDSLLAAMKTLRDAYATNARIDRETAHGGKEHASYLASRASRNDRPGAHSGAGYLAYIEELARRMHSERRQIHPGVAHEYLERA